MSVEDPFFTVKHDVEENLQSLSSYYDSWKRLLSTTNTSANQEFAWTTGQIQDVIKALDYDLNDLEETVRIVELNPHKFKLDDGEIVSRKRFISVAKTKVKEVVEDMSSPTTKGKLDRDKRETLMKTSAVQSARETAQTRFDKQMETDNQRFLEQNSVQIQMERQDQHLDAVADTVSKLKQQANTIGDELEDQNAMLGNMEDHVDSVSGRLRSAMNKMKDVYEKSNEKMSFWLIGGLVLVIIILIILMMSL